MNKLDYFLMVARVTCMALAVATFVILPSATPGAFAPSYMTGLVTSIELHLFVWFPTAIGVQVCSICQLLGPHAHYGDFMVVGHWWFSALCVGTASAAVGVITEENFRYSCSGSYGAICQRYELSAGLAMLLGTLSVIVSVVVNVARLTHGPHVLAIAGQQ